MIKWFDEWYKVLRFCTLYVYKGNCKHRESLCTYFALIVIFQSNFVR